MDALELKRILELHKIWLNGDKEGVRANLRGADLRGADLRGADLRGANLRGANLRGADLRGATTDDKFVQASCIGSSKRMTTYNATKDEIFCGCFKGTLEQFEKRVEETHKDNAQYLSEYRSAIAFFKAIKNGGMK